MRLRLTDLLCFIVFFVLAAASQFPAAWLAPWIDRASAGHWRLADASGVLWNGSGMLLARTSDKAPWRNVQSIRWQLQWSELLAARISLATTLEQGAMWIVASPGGVAVQQLDVTLPGTEISSQFPGPLGRYGWAGTIHARSADFQCDWKIDICNGEIELLWSDAAVAEIRGPILGDYRLHLVGEGSTLRGDLTTLRGRLNITGNGDMSGNGLNFKGEAAATGDDATSLSALLGTLGRPTGVQGKYLIDYREAGSAQKM